MATHYVNLDGATGAGDGTSASDEAGSFAALTLSASDTVSFRRGSMSRGVTIATALDHITFTQHGSGDAPWVRGDIQLPPIDWSDEGNGTYSAVLATEPDAMMYNIGTSIDEYGRHYGHLPQVADAATCASTDGSWAWESGEVFVNPTASMTVPTSGGDYSYSETGVLAGIRTTGDYASVKNMQASFWTENTPDRGYGIRMEGSYSTATGCRTDDCGYHGIGLVTAALQNGTVRNCSIWGSANTMFVMHSNGGDVVNATVDGLDFHIYSRLGVDGQPLAVQSFGAYYAHSAGVGEVKDITNSRVTFQNYGDANCNLVNAGNCVRVVEDDRHAWANYSVAFVDSEIINGSYIDIGNGVETSIAWVRSKLNLSDAANYPEPSNDAAIRIFTTGQMLFESSPVHATLNGTTTDCVFYLRANSTAKLTFIGGQVTFDGTGGNTNSAIFDSNGWSQTGGLRCYGTVFEWRGDAAWGALFKLMGTNKFTPAEHTFDGCWYYKISIYRYAYGNTSYDEESEWLASVDTTGVYATDPELSLVDGHYTPDEGGNLYTTLIPDDELPAYTPTLGVNGLTFDSHYGAWQYGPSPTGSLLNAHRLPRGIAKLLTHPITQAITGPIA